MVRRLDPRMDCRGRLTDLLLLGQQTVVRKSDSFRLAARTRTSSPPRSRRDGRVVRPARYAAPSTTDLHRRRSAATPAIEHGAAQPFRGHAGRAGDGTYIDPLART